MAKLFKRKSGMGEFWDNWIEETKELESKISEQKAEIRRRALSASSDEPTTADKGKSE